MHYPKATWKTWPNSEISRNQTYNQHSFIFWKRKQRWKWMPALPNKRPRTKSDSTAISEENAFRVIKWATIELRVTQKHEIRKMIHWYNGEKARALARRPNTMETQSTKSYQQRHQTPKVLGKILSGKHQRKAETISWCIEFVSLHWRLWIRWKTWG